MNRAGTINISTSYLDKSSEVDQRNSRNLTSMKEYETVNKTFFKLRNMNNSKYGSKTRLLNNITIANTPYKNKRVVIRTCTHKGKLNMSSHMSELRETQ